MTVSKINLRAALQISRRRIAESMVPSDDEYTNDFIEFLQNAYPKILLFGVFPEHLKSQIVISFATDCDPAVTKDFSIEIRNMMQNLGIISKLFKYDNHDIFEINVNDYNLLRLNSVHCDNFFDEFETVNIVNMEKFYQKLLEKNLIQF